MTGPSALELNRTTLSRQMLLGREDRPLSEAVRQVVALQAQLPPAPYVALWNRIAGFRPDELDLAFADGTIVKANVLRVTLHAVHRDHYRAFREATEPSLRSARLGDPRFIASGLTAADADATVPELLGFADRPRTAAECLAWLQDRHGPDLHPGAWWGIRQYAPLLRAPTGGPWAFDNRVAYRAPADPPAHHDADAHERALGRLIVRYLSGFGPATIADIAQFAMVQRKRVRQALHRLGDAVVRLDGPSRPELYDLPDAPIIKGDTPVPPRLLGMWDNLLLAYHDRSRVIPETYRKLVIRNNGDVLPTLLVDGRVAGVWRMVAGRVEATAFHSIPRPVWDALAEEATSLTRMLEARGDLAPFRRFDHWWSKLSPNETRLLSD